MKQTIPQTESKFVPFMGFKETVGTFLKSYDIADSTIARIKDRIVESGCGPIFVYRKAVIFCSLDSSQHFFEELSQPYKEKFPLILSFTKDGINICNQSGEFHYCDYDNIDEFSDDFRPLIVTGKSQKDAYKALDFGKIITALFRALKEDGNKTEDCIITIFNLIYITLFPLNENQGIIKSVLEDNKQDAYERLKLIWEKHFDLAYFKEANVFISEDTFKYVRALLQNDTNDLDIEVLSSIVYKLFNDKDATLYGHQTSFINVQKVISPLILDPLKQVLKNGTDEELKETAEKIVNITCIDPTNSPGCFLSAAIMGLQDILEQIDSKLGTNFKNELSAKNFVSIVDNMIAYELTKLTITYSFLCGNRNYNIQQFNNFFSQLSVYIGPALRMDWRDFTNDINNTYIIGSPRFLGARKIPNESKIGMFEVFETTKLGNKDYCSGWLAKAAKTISNTNGQAAFVLTNSIVQGVQVAEIWPTIYDNNCEISFAHTSFKWKTNESTNVGVTVVVIGIANRSDSVKKLFQGEKVIECNKIGPYLLPNTEAIVKESNKNLFGVLPLIRKGDMPYDNNNLLVNTFREFEDLIDSNKEAKRFVKRISGSEEFINSARRWCIWIPDDRDLVEAEKVEEIKERIERVREFRKTSSATPKCKENPHKFRETYATDKGKQSLIIPSVSSENRPYIPIGFVNDNMIISNLAFAVYNCDIWVLAIISSRMHMNWVRTICGSLETRYRYSNTLGYNTFPIPELSNEDKYILKMLVLRLIEVREHYCDMSLGDLYNNMPLELSEIHTLIDEKVDSLYKNSPFEDDFERISLLINMYQNKIAQ